MKGINGSPLNSGNVMSHHLALDAAVPSPPLTWVNKRKIVMRVAWIVAIPFTLGLFSQNPVLTVCGFLLLPVMVQVLWQPHEPPVLLFAAFFQWMQAFTPVMAADMNGLAVGEEINLPDEMALACSLSLLGIAVLVAGMRCARGNMSADYYLQGYFSTRWVKPNRVLWLFIFSFAINQLIVGALWLVPGLTQFLMPVSRLHIGMVILVLLLAVHDTRFRRLAYPIGLFQIAYGFMGFFSNYKEIFFYAVIAIFSNPFNVRDISLIKSALFLMVVLSVGLSWQAIKVDYRAFLNQGESSQVILVSPEARVAYLANAFSNLDFAKLTNQVESLVSRLGYVEFFAHTISWVPKQVPYQRGKLWGEAFQHMMKPRIFFPDKPIVDDSARTNTYTGLLVADAEKGASIGIGYLPESYIDFGPVFMFIPIFLVGWMWGRVFRYLVQRSPYRLVDIALAINFLIPSAIQFEASNIKIVGGTVSGLIILTVAMRFLSTPIWKYLTGIVR